ncbi:MAG: FAD-dependent oxidoreductase [Candidatus Marinimicrobia bacterium]|jgi:monoamine oxidase|nr:FAD-dependent oxidoreductase [Candidatus Neomarinimicrobiota bacterium]MDP6727133.1 FAD-dependent oxidoreductase [Candidatus Neomarinimicrobiota bacterium]|tara:strand:+ start:349 stop:501 length:153 start_codon:yes stop_codon:yes gene_type:complete
MSDLTRREFLFKTMLITGEHASDYHGWMQGAIVSGLRAATEIHESASVVT